MKNKEGEVHPSDVRQAYGALSAMYVEGEEKVTKERFREVFFWGDYLDDVLEEVVDEFEDAEKLEDGYTLSEDPVL